MQNSGAPQMEAKIAIALGDCNIKAERLIKPGLLEARDLEITLPSNSSISCTTRQNGSLVDQTVIAKGFKPLVASYEAVAVASWGTRYGHRLTLVHAP